MKPLIIIPARGGSKGIPHKNIKPLCGKPLIYYTIDCARKLVSDEDICVSTDDAEIIKCVEEYGLSVPFIRPQELATDTSGSHEVLVHALNFYKRIGKEYDCIVLLQVTSPFRKDVHVKEALSLYQPALDMVVSVRDSATNPYYNCFQEGNDGFLHRVLDNSGYTRRHDAPITYEYNGSIYVINPDSLLKKSMGKFARVKKYIMDEIYSLDIDTPLDLHFAEFVIREHLVEL